MISIRNYNYEEATKDLNVDLLNHPEYIEKNATFVFLVAIWRWMTPIKENQPSAHDVFIGNWKPTKNDNLAKRVSGFGTTMNVLCGDLVCGKGNNETSVNNIVRDILDILAQCNKLKSNPTCTSSLRFSHLYILMLGFIVTQVLYYTLIQ